VKKGGRCIADVDDEARHEVRKDAKKLRYAAEFFKSMFERKRERRRFKRFVAALEELLNRLGVDDDPGAATLLAKGSKEALLDAAADAHHQWVDIKRYWR
jgi:CHAD domain-containing protein